MQRRSVLFVAIITMLALVFAGMFVASMTGARNGANAASEIYVGRQWMNEDAFNLDPNMDEVFVLTQAGEDASIAFSSSDDLTVTYVGENEGYFEYTLNGSDTFKISAAGHTDEPVGIELISGDGTEENPLVFKGIWALEFTVGLEETVLYVDNSSINHEIEATYEITKNPGVNTMLLVPSYDHSVFSLDKSSITIRENPLGAALITGDEVDADVIKIQLGGDNVAPLTTIDADEDSVFLTMTFTLKAATAGEYPFGLVLQSNDENGASMAAYINTQQNVGTLPLVPIEVKTETLELISREQPVITIGYNLSNQWIYFDNSESVYSDEYVFEYGKKAVELEQADSLVLENEDNELKALNPESDVADLTVYYTFEDASGNKLSGDSAPAISVVWSYYNSNQEEWLPLVNNDTAPMLPGKYRVVLSSEAKDSYYAASATGYVEIIPRRIYVNINDATSVYGDEIVLNNVNGALTTTSVCEGDVIRVTFSTTAEQGSSVGDYSISGAVDLENSVGFVIDNPYQDQGAVYNVVFRRTNTQTDEIYAVYTITPIHITATIDPKSSAYGEDLVQLTYSLSPVVNGLTLTLSTNANNLIPGEYDIVIGSYNFGGNYVLDNPDASAKYTITSAPESVAHFTPFFNGETVTYNSQAQDLLTVTTPEDWWTYEVSSTGDGRMQTNANVNPYTMVIVITIKDGYTGLYSLKDGETTVESLSFSVQGTIQPTSVTIKPVNNGHIYGNNPEELTYEPTVGTVYQGDNLNVQYTVKDSNEDVVMLSSDTPVGAYTISISSVSNSNYIITYTSTGTYTVSPAPNTVTISASDVYYNRPLSVSATATTGTPVITYYSDSECETPIETPVNHGTYYVKATVAASQNYQAGESDVATFKINRIQLSAPTLTYNGKTVTLSVITTDVGELELKEGTVLTYTVNDTDVSANLIYTAPNSLSDGLAYTVSSSNDNYLDATGTTLPVYVATFVKGNVNGWSNNPDAIYVFKGQTITIPNNVPVDADDAKEFSGWEKGSSSFAAGDVVTMNASYEFTAVWGLQKYTIIFKYYNTAETLNENMFSKEVSHGYTVVLPAMEPERPAITGKTITFTDTWSDGVNTYGVSNGILTLNNADFHVTADMTLVAVFNIVDTPYTITYYFSNNGSTTYPETPWKVVDDMHYGDTIEYDTFDGDNYAWFIKDAWYSNGARTQVAPTTMPNESIVVYGSYIFDIGTGDVNGSGTVTTDDITLYRRWIVGGYTMTVVESGNEWATATDSNFNANGVYFLKRVADINVDDSKDIRDVSITRMALVGGYSWEKETGYTVTGDEIIRSLIVTTYEQLVSALEEGRAYVANYINAAAEELSVTKNNGNIYLDLGHSTINVSSLTLIANENNATITVLNGTIIAQNGITIMAPNGNVVFSDVYGYVNNAPINLQAASSSLHLNNDVAFYNKEVTPDASGSVTFEQEEVVPKADIVVAENTHIVVEPDAEVRISTIKVATVSGTTFTEDDTKTITITNTSEATDAIEIVGNYVEENSTVESKVITRVSTLAELIAANGKTVYLSSNINAGGTDITYTEDVTINLNGYNITFSGWGFEARQGATLTINGDGTVSAAEACLYAQYAGKLVVNGGTFISTNNFVVATNGSAGRGGNEITINGGVFTGSMSAAGSAEGYIACGVYVANNDTVVVNGGTFNIENGCGILARSGNTTIKSDVVFNMTGEATEPGKVGDSRVVVPVGEKLVLDLKAAYPGGVPTINNETVNDVYVIVDGTYTFAGDDASFHAARGVYDNVILTGDFDDYLYVTKDMNIYLNGHTVDASATSYVAIYVVEGAKVTINGDGLVKSTEGCVLALDGSEFTINGGTYICYDNFIFGTNGTKNRGNNVITVNAGTFNGQITSSGYIACGIYVANNDTVTVNGGTFNITNGIGILCRSGNTTVKSGVVFNMLGDNEISGIVGDAKQPAIQSGLVLIQDFVANYPGGDPVVTNNSGYVVTVIE